VGEVDTIAPQIVNLINTHKYWGIPTSMAIFPTWRTFFPTSSLFFPTWTSIFTTEPSLSYYM